MGGKDLTGDENLTTSEIKLSEPVADETSTENTTTENKIDLSSMTKSELLNFAEDNGIDGVDGGMKKAEILETIENSLNDEIYENQDYTGDIAETTEQEAESDV